MLNNNIDNNKKVVLLNIYVETMIKVLKNNYLKYKSFVS